jgi:hypothetical protein
MKIPVPDIDPPAGLCWHQRLAAPHSMERCPLPKGHHGPCLPDLVAENEALKGLLPLVQVILDEHSNGTRYLSRVWLKAANKAVAEVAALDAKGPTR